MKMQNISNVIGIYNINPLFKFLEEQHLPEVVDTLDQLMADLVEFMGEYEHANHKQIAGRYHFLRQMKQAISAGYVLPTLKD